MLKIDKIKLPKNKDRRRKLTEENKENIKKLYYTDNLFIRKIARIYKNKCSRRLIQFILFPERMEHNAELYKERRKDGRYYNREKHTKAIRNLRKYKKQLEKKGEL